MDVKMKRLFSNFIFISLGIFLFTIVTINVVFAQTVVNGPPVCTKIGDPISISPCSTATSSASCPVVGGVISTHSYQADPVSGHCSGSYSYPCACGTDGRRAKAIDIQTNGNSVVLPTIEGQSVEWKLTTKDYPVSGGEGGGIGETFEATVGINTWYLDMLHLNPTSLSSGSTYPSGTSIGTTVIDHVHMTIGKNLRGPVVAGTGSDCDSGWLPSDFMCLPTSAAPGPNTTSGTPTLCSGDVVSLGYNKQLLPLPGDSSNCSGSLTGACGRPGTCVVPQKIVLHVTASDLSANDVYKYFAGGSAGRGVGAHFIIDKDGTVIQVAETLENRVEVAYAVANYSDHISIEMVSSNLYGSKSEAPTAQYQAALTLVKKLMNQYGIPVGNLSYDWRAPSDLFTSLALPGVYGHYQLNPLTRTDPGIGILRDMRQDL